MARADARAPLRRLRAAAPRPARSTSRARSNASRDRDLARSTGSGSTNSPSSSRSKSGCAPIRRGPTSRRRSSADTRRRASLVGGARAAQRRARGSARFAWSTPPPPSFRRTRRTTTFRAASSTRCARRRAKRSSSSAAGRFASGRGSSSTTAACTRRGRSRRGRRSPVVVNNNPETVSTDFDISDVLVFEPPGADEVEAAYRATNARGRDARVRRPDGDQSRRRAERGAAFPSSAATARSLDMAENREQFDAALARLGVARPNGKAARSFREARAIARELGFPVLVRPSFVLGGRGDGDRLQRRRSSPSYAESAPPILPDAPLLVDKYLRGLEVEVDAVFDGDDMLIPGHLRARRARRHSFRRLDQRLSRRRRSTPRWSAGSPTSRWPIARELGHPRPDQHPVRRPRRRRCTSSKPIRARAARCRSFRRRPASISSPPPRASRSARSCATWSTERDCCRTCRTSSSKCPSFRSRRCAASKRCSDRR